MRNMNHDMDVKNVPHISLRSDAVTSRTNSEPQL
jgi:hypothetical protein